MPPFKKTIDRLAGRSKRPREVTGDERQVFFTLATSLIGRSPEDGAAFDDQVRTLIGVASSGTESAALVGLARAVRDHEVPITIEELSTFGRCARLFEVPEDGWTFLGASVAR